MRCSLHCEKKIPLRFSDIFLKRLGTFNQFLHIYYTFLSTLAYKQNCKMVSSNLDHPVHLYSVVRAWLRSDCFANFASIDYRGSGWSTRTRDSYKGHCRRMPTMQVQCAVLFTTRCRNSCPRFHFASNALCC